MLLFPSSGGYVTESIKVRIKPKVWERFVKETNYTGCTRDTGAGVREIYRVTPQGFLELDFPGCYVWSCEDLDLIGEE